MIYDHVHAIVRSIARYTRDAYTKAHWAAEYFSALSQHRTLALECVEHLSAHLINNVSAHEPTLANELRLDRLRSRILLTDSANELNDIVIVLIFAMRAIDVVPKRAPTVFIPINEGP